MYLCKVPYIPMTKSLVMTFKSSKYALTLDLTLDPSFLHCSRACLSSICNSITTNAMKYSMILLNLLRCDAGYDLVHGIPHSSTNQVHLPLSG